MKTYRTTLILPEALDTALRQEAARRGITVSELTREAIARHLGLVVDADTEGGVRRRLLSAGAGDSGRSDISVRIEELLREDFGRET